MIKAGIEDIPRIQAMAEVVFRETYRDLISPEQMEFMMDMMYSSEKLLWQMTERHDTFYFIEGQGYVSFRPDGVCADGRPRYHLEKLYVMPSCQGRGLGRLLFGRIVDAVREVSPSLPAVLELNVNRGNPAVSFYEHLGMRKDRSGDFDIGCGFFMNDFIMALTID